MTDVSSGQFLQGPCPSLALSELPFRSTPPLFDVRTAEAYAQGYIPEALNQPLFDRLEPVSYTHLTLPTNREV